MRSSIELARYAVDHPMLGPMDPQTGGAFRVKTPTGTMNVVASWGAGWDHVSVSRPNRTPTWAEMDFIKRVFFRPDEVAIQIHPAESDHIIFHPHCLHLWRSHTGKLELPPKWMIGPEVAA